MNTQTENLIPEQLSRVEDEDATRPPVPAAARKKFIEPAVSFPIDVLEATTFFQATDSGTAMN